MSIGNYSLPVKYKLKRLLGNGARAYVVSRSYSFTQAIVLLKYHATLRFIQRSSFFLKKVL